MRSAMHTVDIEETVRRYLEAHQTSESPIELLHTMVLRSSLHRRGLRKRLILAAAAFELIST